MVLARQSELVRRFLRATVKGQRFYLAHGPGRHYRDYGIYAAQTPRIEARVCDDHMKTIARDGTISDRLQQIVIDRSKRLTGVTRDVRLEEIFDFSFIRTAQAEVSQSGWTP